MTLSRVVMKVIKRFESETVNGPLVRVVLVPDGALETNAGTLTLMLFDESDLAAYQVGKRFRFTPEVLP